RAQREIDLLVEVLLLDVRQEIGVDREAREVATGREPVVAGVVVLQSQTGLFEVVLAPGPVGGLTALFHGRQDHAHQDSDDGDDHQKLDQRERGSGPFAKNHAIPLATEGWKERQRLPARRSGLAAAQARKGCAAAGSRRMEWRANQGRGGWKMRE